MIRIIESASGKEYAISVLDRGYQQYMDRQYQFDYVPDELRGCAHIMTCGNDKMTPEDALCFSLETDCPVDIFVLFADKHPILPKWLLEYKRVRMNVTRLDSMPWNLKGYFSLFQKSFPAGEIYFYGNSSHVMLDQDWYVNTEGANYCMYTVAVVEKTQ